MGILKTSLFMFTGSAVLEDRLRVFSWKVATIVNYIFIFFKNLAACIKICCIFAADLSPVGEKDYGPPPLIRWLIFTN